jgi:predicted nucleic acid-binding protein
MARPGRSRHHQRVREAAPARYGAALPALTGILLDSDVVIEALRGNARVASEMERLVDDGVRPGEETTVESFFHARGEVAIDSLTGRRAGAYLLRYSKSHAVGIGDALIAAAAATTGLRLWTLNRRHYPMDDIEFYESSIPAR